MPRAIAATPGWACAGGRSVLRSALRGSRKVVIAVIGVSALIVGVMMIVLPGPAVVVIPAGLAILGIEFAWARRWLLRAKQWMALRASRATGSSPGAASDTDLRSAAFRQPSR